MQSREQERTAIAVFLEGAVSAGASSEQIAGLVATACRGIDQVLSPILGQRGTSALYRRSLQLARPAFPWLPVAVEGIESGLDVAALAAALAARTSAEAASSGTHLLEQLRALLATLIGELLTERVLRPVRATFLGDPMPGSRRQATST